VRATCALSEHARFWAEKQGESKMMNSIARTAVVAALAAGAALASAQGINVQVNGNPVTFTNTQPQYISGRVLVPLRGVFEEMGADVQWHPETRSVTAQQNGQSVALRIGEKWATVDGKTVSLDVPAMIVGDSTMVPIRFISESLGAQVRWYDPTRTVLISTTNSGVSERPITFANRRRFNLREGMVIPVVLDSAVSSRDSQRGDYVRARVNGFNSNGADFDFPQGTVIEGTVKSAVPRHGNNPGLIEMGFNRIVMPNGDAVPISGSLISLDSRSVSRENGVLVARNSDKDNRLVYAGYGAGAGLIVGLMSHRPLENLAIGGILGYLVGSLQQARQQPADVILEPGTRFGVRLDRAATVSLRD
jgi:hypothetical protein